MCLNGCQMSSKRGLMYKMLILSIVALLSVGCSSSKDESGGSSISLNDIKANLAGKKYFAANTPISSSSNSRTANASSSTSTDSLLVIDDQNVIDYGVISKYDLPVDRVLVDKHNTYAYILLKYEDDYNSERNKNVRKLNCAIFRVDLETNKIDCLEEGLMPIFVDREWERGDQYAVPSMQFTNKGNIYLMSYGNYGITAKKELFCNMHCLYLIKDGNVKKITKNGWQNRVFYAFESGKVGYIELEEGNNTSPESPVRILDTNGNIWDTSERSGGRKFFMGGDYDTLLDGSIELTRLVDGKIVKSYMMDHYISMYVKGNDGRIIGHGNQYLISVLPSANNPIFTFPINRNCSVKDEIFCSTYIKIYNNIALISYYLNSDGGAVTFIALNLDTGDNVTVLKPNKNCENNCYLLERWYQLDNNIYASMKDNNKGSYTNIKIDLTSIDFNSSGDQFELYNELNESMSNKKLGAFTGIQSKMSQNGALTATIKHDNSSIAARIEFSHKMDYADVESKITVIDNDSSTPIWFMPVWNNKTVHLVYDTDNGTVFDDQPDTLPTGHTYKITLKGTAKDSDGNSIGSDVVAYVYP